MITQQKPKGQQRKRKNESFLLAFAQRLEKLMADRGMSVSDLKEKSGVSGSQLYEYCNAEKAPGSEILAKLCVALEADANDLIGIEGQYVSVPLYPDKVSGGHGREVHPTDEAVRDIHFRSDWLDKKKKRNREALGAFSVTGPSMAPHVTEKDIVLFDRTLTSGEGVFVVRINNDLSVKRLQPLPGGDVELWGKDDKANDKSYGTIPKAEIAAGHFRVIGKVFWRGGEV